MDIAHYYLNKKNYKIAWLLYYIAWYIKTEKLYWIFGWYLTLNSLIRNSKILKQFWNIFSWKNAKLYSYPNYLSKEDWENVVNNQKLSFRNIKTMIWKTNFLVNDISKNIKNLKFNNMYIIISKWNIKKNNDWVVKDIS